MDLSTLVPTLSIVTLLIALVVFGLGGLRGARKAKETEHPPSALAREGKPHRPLPRGERA